jgi:hypothetical protein
VMRYFVGVMLVAGAMAMSGCRLGGSVSTETALNQLRAEQVELKGRLAAAEGEKAELQAKLARALEGKGVDAEAAAALPVCTRVEIGGLSGVNRAGDVELLVKTLDGRERFVQMAATMTVSVGKGVLPPLRFTPLQVREMYRSGVMGTYYLVTVPGSRWAAGDVVTVEVEDHATGRRHVGSWGKAEGGGRK